MDKQQQLRLWRQQGSIWLYRVKRWRGEAWHLEGDDAGFASLLELLVLMQNAEYPIPRTLTISKPPHGPDLRNDRYAKTWKLDYVPSTAMAAHWEWSDDTDHPILQLGTELFAEFIKCVADERCEDYGIGKKEAKKSKNIAVLAEAQLWFWRTMRPA